MTARTSQKTFTSFLWRFAEQCGAQGVTLVVSIILARLLDPASYGTVALVTVFTGILGVFVDSGFGNALIQKKDADNLDFSSVFWFNIVMCCLLYSILFFCAPLIADFYHDTSLVPLVRVSSLTLIISGVKNVQCAYVSRNMLFKRFFFATLGGTIGAAVIGIYLAFRGYGVWALVVQSLFNHAVDTIILWATVKWRPQFCFSFQRMKGLFSFGWKMLASSLLDTGYGKLQDLIIGRMYTAADLAFYSKGGHFPSVVVSNINSSINSVLLPVMSAEQDNRERVKTMTRRTIKTSTYLMMPMMMGLAVCAEPLVRILLTEKWVPCVPYMRIYCFSYAFYPIHTANLNAIKAMGRSDYYLRLEIIKKIYGLTIIFITMWHGVMCMAYSMILSTFVCQIINSYPNKKLLNYSYPEQVQDMLPQILLSRGMGVAVYCVSFLHMGDWATLIVQIALARGKLFLQSRGKEFFNPLKFCLIFPSTRSNPVCCRFGCLSNRIV